MEVPLILFFFKENDSCNSFHGGPSWIWRHWSGCQADFLSWHAEGSWGAILRTPIHYPLVKHQKCKDKCDNINLIMCQRKKVLSHHFQNTHVSLR